MRNELSCRSRVIKCRDKLFAPLISAAAIALLLAMETSVTQATTVECISNMAHLRAKPAGGCVQLLGYYARGDGGGGTFYWDSGSSRPSDEGTIIVPNGWPPNRPGRWIRLPEPIVSLKVFGAVGDGTSNDTQALKRAMVA